MAARTSAYRRYVACAVVACSVAVWMAGRSEAIIIIDGMPAHFGPLSLVRGQTLRFYLANAADARGEPTFCVADVMAYDARGNMIASSRVEAQSGETAFVDMVGQKVMPGQQKVVLRLVADVHPPNPIMPAGQCIGTAEVFNAHTGRTEFFVGADAVSGIDPPPF